MFMVARSLGCQPRRVKCSCAQLYAAPNGAKKSASASVPINIAPLRGCRAERSIPRTVFRVTQVHPSPTFDHTATSEFRGMTISSTGAHFSRRYSARRASHDLSPAHSIKTKVIRIELR